ncbi:hypothetical protein IAS59_006338 [Cryptococcus gattii]
MRLSSLALAGIQLLTVVAALPNITRTGKYLYDESGHRFYIKGVAYQPEGQLAASSDSNSANGGFPEPSSFYDPLSSPQNCTRDLPYLQQLGVNAVRVYSVNSSLNHDDCMKMFNDAGIYVLLDVSLPLNGSIDRSSPSWSTNLLNSYIETIDAFKDYENILGFNIGNEVVNLVSNTNAAPFVKAAARDIKAYLKSVGSSALVGYAAVDGEADFRNSLAEYLTCGGDSIAVDLYGLNNYEWCGNENINSSNWNTITEGFSDLPVATYMSEFGCITSPPRLWTEVTALYASPVSDVFSGGVAFSYFPTSDGYGMVTISNNNTSLLASSTLPPTPDEKFCNCINENSLSCIVKQSSANSPEIVGTLLDYTCSLLGSTDSSASCDPIAGNGTSGTYGQLSFCSPAIKLSYVMSTYYQFNPKDTSCDFGGNATLSANRPNTVQDANAAASSCLAAEPSGGVFTPTAPGSAAATATSSGAASGSTSSAASSDSSASTSGGLRSITVVGGMLTALVGIGGILVGGSATLL